MLFRRILWHVNRTPLAKVIKFARRQTHRRELSLRRQLARELPVLPAAKAVARNLRENGYSDVTGLIPLASREMLAGAVAEAGRPPASGGTSSYATRKDFWVHVLESEMVDGSLPASSPYARFALQPEVLSVLSEIYGELPRLSYVAITRSLPTESDYQISQLWHRDYDDTRVIKLFVYLTDVGEGDGPFTFLPAPISDQVGFTLRSHQSDERIGRSVDLGQAVSMSGPKLTAFMVETSRCLHMGSRVEAGHSRLMYTATYVSAPAIYPERQKPFFKLAGSETPLERCALHSG
jgi:hypothetical protein